MVRAENFGPILISACPIYKNEPISDYEIEQNLFDQSQWALSLYTISGFEQCRRSTTTTIFPIAGNENCAANGPIVASIIGEVSFQLSQNYLINSRNFDVSKQQ